MNVQLIKWLAPFVLLAFTQCTNGQDFTITGNFSQLKNQPVKLMGFNGLEIYTIDSTQTNQNGFFELQYTKQDVGMGYLTSSDKKPFIVVLSGNAIELKGELLGDASKIDIVKDDENQSFEQYASEHARREQALSAWVYLEKIYVNDSLFSKQQAPLNAIEQEKKRINHEDELFLNQLPKDSYVSWYLPLRKLVTSVSIIAQYRTAEIPTTVAALRNIDYTDHRLYKSGLLRDVIESHVWLIENSGRPLDSMYIEMNVSIDRILESLAGNEQKLNEISDYLFKLLEKRSLFNASEYLALKLLNENSCTINNDLAAQLESYRAMKKGNTAPDIVFPSAYLAPGYPETSKPTKLSEVQNAYKVVVFGASWCPQCPQELSQIMQLYSNWKKHNVEVVFVSLDTDPTTFRAFAGQFPFISICDFKQWDSPIASAYYIFATPTIYLLNDKHEIVLRPNSAKHLDSWIDWYLVKGNK